MGPFPGSISTSLGPLAGCGIEGAHAIVRTMGERDREPTMSIEPWARQHCPFSMANRQAPGAAARLPPSFPCRVGVLIRHHGDRASAERVRRMKTKSPKKRRAKRARARQRSRYDLRDRYRRRDLPAEHIAVAVIEDPYSQAGYVDAEGNLSAEARLTPVLHPDGSEAPGAPEWVPPRRPMMTVVRALREDPVGRMFARHQIDTAQYQAARAFQQAADQSTIGSIKSVDLEKTKVSGGLSPEPLTDGRRRAMARLRVAEERLSASRGRSWSNARASSRQLGCAVLNPIVRCGSGVGSLGGVSIRSPAPSGLLRRDTDRGDRTGTMRASKIPPMIRGGRRTRAIS